MSSKQINHDLQAFIEAHVSDVWGGAMSPRQQDALERGQLQTMTVDMAIDGQLMVLQLAHDDGELVVESVDFVLNAGGGA